MRKIWLILLITALCLTLTACGGYDEDDDSGDDWSDLTAGEDLTTSTDYELPALEDVEYWLYLIDVNLDADTVDADMGDMLGLEEQVAVRALRMLRIERQRGRHPGYRRLHVRWWPACRIPQRSCVDPNCKCLPSEHSP